MLTASQFVHNSIIVKFKVKCTQTTLGQVVGVTGDSKELGNWNPAQGISLQTNPQDFPLWTGKIKLEGNSLNGRQKLQYKYVISGQDGTKLWEPIIDNRTIDIQNVTEIDVEDVYGQPKHLMESLQKFEQIKAQPDYGEEPGSDMSLANSAVNQKVVMKVKQVKNVQEEYYQLVQKAHGMSQKRSTNQASLLRGINDLKIVEEEPYQQRHGHFNPSHHLHQSNTSPLLRSIDDQQRKEALKYQRDHPAYNLINSEGLEQSSNSNLFNKKLPKSPLHNDQIIQKQFNMIAGTTGGVISSDEDDEKIDESDDDDMVEEDKKLLEDVKISADDVVIVASFRLPISIDKDPTSPNGWKVRTSRSLLYPTLFQLREKNQMVKTHWIGWPGIIPENDKEAQEIADLLKEYDCVPVFFNSDTIEKFLYFHESVLRPLFHNFKGLNDFEYDLGKQELWQIYQTVNTKFATIVTELKQEKEMIWIHDNYLLLVPTYVRRRDNNANIGFFMHSPFPSSDIYKMFPYRGEVLKSLLACDLIGFHLFEYARNFYTACRRIMGLNHDIKKGGFLGVECFGRNVMLRISHIGIQTDDILEAMETNQFKSFVKELNQTVKKRNIMASIDRFHPISGLKNKLLAYQKFLRQQPTFQKSSCLIQYVIPSDCPKCQSKQCSHQMINQTRSEIVAIIQEIEQEFGEGAVIFLEKDLTVEQRLALWAVSNILLITTLRDGQCIPPLEFITVKRHLNKSGKSAVILSEFSGCNRALGGVLKINPFNVDEIAKSIETAISMTAEEKEQRFKIAYNYISKHSTLRWAEAFLKDLKRSHQPCENESKYMVIGFGLNQNLIKTRSGFQELKLQILESKYERANNRLIIIDQEGVLPMKGSMNKALEPLPHIIQALDEISRDDRNTIFIISSQTKSQLHKWYAKYAPHVGLAAENGFFWRQDSVDKDENKWIKLLKLLDFCWIESVKDIMQSYTEKTDGAFIEEKESMIVWNYKDTDPDFGNWQAKELISHLEHVFVNLPIGIVHGKKCLEVVPNQLKKQKLVKLILEGMAKKAPVGFVLYIGDDSGNEPVFTYLNNKKHQNSKLLAANASVYTCTIGRKATQAKYFLNDSDSVVQMLETLQCASMQAKRTKSFADFNKAKMDEEKKGGHKYFHESNMRQGSDVLRRGGTQAQFPLGKMIGNSSSKKNDKFKSNADLFAEINSEEDVDAEETSLNAISNISSTDNMFKYEKQKHKESFK